MAPQLNTHLSTCSFCPLLFPLLLSNLLQAQLTAPDIGCHLLGAVQTVDTYRIYLSTVIWKRKGPAPYRAILYRNGALPFGP